MKLQHWTKNKSRSARCTKQNDRSDDSDSSQYRKRRSRSREHRSERRSRNRYDSSDRRMKDRARHYSQSKRRKGPECTRKSPECLGRNSENLRKSPENSRSLGKNPKRDRREESSEKRLRNLNLDSSPDEKMVTSKTLSSRPYRSGSSDIEVDQKSKDEKKIEKPPKRKWNSEDKGFSSQDESNVPEQYRTSNFTKSSEKKAKS